MNHKLDIPKLTPTVIPGDPCTMPRPRLTAVPDPQPRPARSVLDAVHAALLIVITGTLIALATTAILYL